MAADPVRNPPGLTILADNWFHEGWLFAALALPPREFNDPDAPTRDLDIESWEEGYRTAMETPFDYRIEAFAGMLRCGQLRFEPRRR